MTNSTPKTSTRPTGQARKINPADGAVRGRTSNPCACGCGETFQQGRSDQRFLPGHRFKSYTTHRCPTCDTVHRQGKKGQDNE